MAFGQSDNGNIAVEKLYYHMYGECKSMFKH